MPNIAVGQRILVTMRGLYFGQLTMNTFLFRVSVAAADQNDVTFFNALHTKFTGALGLATRLADCTPVDGWLKNNIWYQVVGPTRFRKVEREWVGPGLLDEPTTSPNLQASISRFGDLANRKNMGAIRVPMPTNASTAGGINDSYKLLLQDLADEMILLQTAAGTTLYPQVGVPGYTNTVPPVLRPVTDSVDLTSCVVQNTTRVIRRRTLRVGV